MRTYLPFLLLSVLFSLAATGCGVRTALRIGSDGGDAGPRRDIGPSDARFDAPFDGGSCSSSGECDDGRTCNGFEQCLGGRCAPGPAPDCTDFIECTTDQCVEGAGCISRPNDAICGGGFRCDMFIGCVPIATGCREDFECDDGRFCNGTERCDRDRGVCFSADPPFCDDGVGCTDDSCVEGFGCVSDANPDICMPPAICDRFSGCVVRECLSDFDCNDGDLCNGEESCGPDARCRAGVRVDCNDGSDCTIDRCVPFMGCVSFAEAEVCTDGRDNDCNGLVDCGDFACSGRPECGCVPVSSSEFACSDGRDDDCDGAPDCGDRDCMGRPECGPCAPFEFDCANGFDEDCDGLIDCVDTFDCSGRPECGMCVPVADREISCLDMRDDDCDGRFDCSDPDCGGTMECGVCSSEELDCFNGRDDDCDGLFDCEDDACRGTPECGCFPSSMTEIRCRDGIDDDCDGRVDCLDFDCRTRPACLPDSGIPRDGGPPLDSGPPTDSGVRRELGVGACTNGFDDDRDGRVDCADPDCSPFGPTSECCNGVDDTGDGNVDEFTCRCFDDSVCSSGSLEQVCWASTYSVCAPRCDFYGGDSFCMMIVPDSPRCNRITGECTD